MTSFAIDPLMLAALSAAFSNLVESAVKGLVILLIAGMAVTALPRGSAALRHLIWTLAPIGLLFVPVFSNGISCPQRPRQRPTRKRPARSKQRQDNRSLA